jgi:parvulin-like peptidyl-prolyl isomerase
VRKRETARTRSVRRTIIIAAAAIVTVGAIAGVAIYDDRVRPFQTTVLEVDGTTIKMGYFLKRVAISRQQPVSMLQTLAREEMLKEEAPNPPYSIAVTAQDIDQYARDLARGTSATIGDAEFREWYRQQLNEYRLSDAEFRDLLRTTVLTQKMSRYLGERVPTVADQVFVNMIAVKDAATGAEVKRKFEAGQDFASLAREYSSDAQLKTDGGKVGWFPPGVLLSSLDSEAFALKPGQASDPMYIDDQTTILLMVSARAAARQIDAKSLETLRSKALDNWYQEAYARHTIAFKGFHRGFDSETEAWVQRELLKMGIQLTPSGPAPGGPAPGGPAPGGPTQ